MKQLFVYVTAEYETKPNVLNQVVVWDTIISDSPSVRTRPLRVTAPPPPKHSRHSHDVLLSVCVSPPLQAWIRSSQTVNKYALTDQVCRRSGANPHPHPHPHPNPARSPEPAPSPEPARSAER